MVRKLVFSPNNNRTRVWLLFVLGLFVFGVQCTFVTARTNGQCLNDGDCRARGPSFAQTRCSAVGICEQVVLPEAGAVSGGPCTTNAECNQRLSTKARCVASQCVSITNASCQTVDGDPTDPNAIFVGVLTPRSGPNGDFGLNQYAVVKSAAAEWQSSLSGVAGAHSFVAIGCDEISNTPSATSFLSATIQASAIFGPIYDADFEQALPIATANGTFLFGSRVDDPKLSTMAGIGKTIWSSAPNRKIQVKYFQNLINILEPSVRSTFSITTGDIKVAFLVGSDPSSSNFADAVEALPFTFNGKSLAQNQTNAKYVRVPVPISFSTDNIYSSAVSSLVADTANLPDLVLVAQEYDLLNLVRAIQNGWPTGKFPRFVFFTEDPAVDTELGLPQERFAGKLDFVKWSRSPAESTTASAFAVSYRTASGGDPAAYSEFLYDAFYENAYALQSILDANGNQLFSLDPGAYANAIAGFDAPGTLVNVGPGTTTPNNIVQMLGLLSSKGDADLDGASGPLEFDPAAGSPIQDAELDCITAGGQVKQSSVKFSGASGAASGTYSCL